MGLAGRVRSATASSGGGDGGGDCGGVGRGEASSVVDCAVVTPSIVIEAAAAGSAGCTSPSLCPGLSCAGAAAAARAGGKPAETPEVGGERLEDNLTPDALGDLPPGGVGGVDGGVGSSRRRRCMPGMAIGAAV